ncbi:MAG: polysaccharide deacetylase family protein [Myxococcota bacterium]
MSIIRRPWRGRALLDRARLHATGPLLTGPLITGLTTGLALGASLLVASPATTVHATVDLAPLTATTNTATANTPAANTPAANTPATDTPATTDPVAADSTTTPPPTADLAVITTTTTEPTRHCVVHQPTGHWQGRDHEDQWAAGLYPARERYPEGWLALTFDDGPHLTRTPVVLELLAKHDLHATFFLTGFAIRSSTYHLVQQMVEQGHALANHGWRHDIHMADQIDGLDDLEAYIEAELELTQIRVDLAMMADDAEDFAAMDQRVFGRLHRGRSRQRQLDAMPELRERHQALLKERGFEAGDRPVALRWARPPGGRPYLGRYSARERSAFARVLGRMDLTLVMWNGGSGDSDPHLSPRERMDPERITKTIRKAARRGGIYVAHDRLAARGLRAMIEALAQSDAEVVSLERLWWAKHEARGWCAPTDEPANRAGPTEEPTAANV